MIRGVQQTIRVDHGEGFGAVRDLDDVLPGLHGPFLDDAKVEAGPAMRDEKCGHPRLVHPQPDPIAGDSWLGDLEDSLTDAIAVADADVVVGEAVDGEILTELTVDEVVAPELLLPVSVRVELIHHDRAHLTTVPGQVALSVPVDVEASNPDRPGHR